MNKSTSKNFLQIVIPHILSNLITKSRCSSCFLWRNTSERQRITMSVRYREFPYSRQLQWRSRWIMECDKIMECSNSKWYEALSLEVILTAVSDILPPPLDDTKNSFNHIAKLSMAQIEKLLFVAWTGTIFFELKINKLECNTGHTGLQLPPILEDDNAHSCMAPEACHRVGILHLLHKTCPLEY